MDFADRQYNLFSSHDGFTLFIIFVLCVFSVWNQLNFFFTCVWHLTQFHSSITMKWSLLLLWHMCVCMYMKKGCANTQKYIESMPNSSFNQSFAIKLKLDCWLLWFSIRMRQQKLKCSQKDFCWCLLKVLYA